MKSNIALSFLLFVFIGCGYKPSTSYTKNILGDEISTDVDISIKSPTDSIFLKDALNEAILAVFNSKVSQKSKVSIKLSIVSSDISPLDYDENGYAILYRAKSTIRAYVIDLNNTTSTYTGTGTYDFSLNSESVLNDELKHNAIKESFLKALQMIEFKIANRGMK